MRVALAPVLSAILALSACVGAPEPAPGALDNASSLPGGSVYDSSDPLPLAPELTKRVLPNGLTRITSYNVCYTKLLRNFEARRGFPNTFNLDGNDLLQPRFGFNWTATDRLTVRGGAGLFGGGAPLIILSNSYAGDGISRTFASYNFV